MFSCIDVKLFFKLQALISINTIPTIRQEGLDMVNFWTAQFLIFYISTPALGRGLRLIQFVPNQ